MIELQSVSKTFGGRAQPVVALDEVTFTVRPGEFVAIQGPSGSGKSSLLNILGCLDHPSSGTYLLESIDVAQLNDRSLSRLRSQKIGFVFQSFNLLPRGTALENVEIPMIYRQEAFDRARARAALRQVGLEQRANHFPNELSGGEQQRVAIARALVNDPVLILADEPTGNLDPASAAGILAVLETLHRGGRTIIIVTHDESIAARARRRILIRGGRIVRDEIVDGEVNAHAAP
jgi:putative ABC transport system ATP-binding protein